MLAIILPATSQVREFHPLLTYIFFDSASAVIPDRYHLYRSAGEATSFKEATLPPQTLDIYHHLLNIIGSRMRRHPKTRIEIVGCNSMQEWIGETIEVSTMRGEAVRDYLATIWRIDTSRIRLLAAHGYPQYRSNPKHPLGLVENRRAEIRTDDWQLLQPIVTYDTTPLFEEADSTLDVHTIIMFNFGGWEMGPFNERIVREYVVGGLRKGAKVVVTGHGDVIDEFENFIGSPFNSIKNRVTTTVKVLEREVKPGVIELLHATRTSEVDFIHTNDLPEGRFYNRCVQVRVITPVR